MQAAWLFFFALPLYAGEPQIDPVVQPLPACSTRERDSFTINLKRYVDAPNDDLLRFELDDSQGWYTLDENGKFTAAPGFKQIGPHKISFRVRLGEREAKGNFTLNVARDPRPPVWENNRGSFSTKTREPFTASVGGQAQDLDGLPVEFSKARGPAWVQVEPQGNISGVPQDSDAGDSTVVVRAANDILGSEAKFKIHVEKKNNPPQFVKPLELTLKERETIEVDMSRSGCILDKDDEALAYSASNLPAWIQLQTSGTLTFTPQGKQIGTHHFTIQAKDPAQESVDLPLNITVVRNTRPPQWTGEPLDFHIQSREPFQFSLNSRVQDLDGLPLEFHKISGPEWLTVHADGRLSGTPKDTDVGRSGLEVLATNDGPGAGTRFRLVVEKKNYPPELKKPLEVTVLERESTRIFIPATGCIVDPDEERLTYSAKDLPNWVFLGPSGDLVLQPTYAQIGNHSLMFTAKDVEKGVDLPIRIVVKRNPRPPLWTFEPLVLQFKTREPFKANLADKARDLDGLKFAFEMVKGPTWLTLSPSGVLSGEPTDLQAGKHEVIIRAANPDAGAPKTLQLTIAMKNHPPVPHPETMHFTVLERTEPRWNLSKAPYVEDADRDDLAFTLEENQDWVSLTPEGVFSLRPGFKQIGKHSFTVQVRDAETYSNFSIQVAVDRSPRPPVWTAQNRKLQTFSRVPFHRSVANDVSDLDGFPVHFTKKSGPDWLQISDDGTLSANPTDAEVGKHRLTLQAANDVRAAISEYTLEVLYKNKPPVWEKPAITLHPGKALERYSATVRGLASDPEADTALTYEKVQGPSWVVVSPDGQVFGTPQRKDKGEQEVVIRALDSKRDSADITAKIAVQQEADKIVPNENPLQLPAAPQGEIYGYNMNKLFPSKDFKYKKVSGPDWFGIRPTGEIAAVPSQTGTYDFAVEVSNGRETARFAGKLRVVPNGQ